MPPDEKQPDPRMARRRFCQLAGAGACAVAAAGASALSVDFLRPRVLFEPPTRFMLGAPDAVPVGAVLTEEKEKIFVVRLSDGFRAFSSICTHLGCITRYQPGEGIIACPCHGSKFNLDGEVIAGPAPRPLDQFEIGVSPRGRIVVDKSLAVPPGTVVKL